MYLNLFVAFIVSWWFIFMCSLSFMLRDDEKHFQEDSVVSTTKRYLWQKALFATVVAGVTTWILGKFVM